ncbi:MAG: hypothetical protein JJE22_20015 [Bacteroidia bacterium]|nr:hypothetical protein [Bacteroidia bacterium]
MKTLQTSVLAITLLILFSSCQNHDLSNQETRKGIMNTIANDSIMSQEMLGAMMTNNNGMKMIQEHQMIMGNHVSMVNMLKNNPGMMVSMMSAMMETAKGDSSMMSGMIRTMMENPQMMGMMQNMTGNKMMNNMGGMDNKSHH